MLKVMLTNVSYYLYAAIIFMCRVTKNNNLSIAFSTFLLLHTFQNRFTF